MNDEMWFVIEEESIETIKIDTTGRSTFVPKPRFEWIAKDRKRANLDNVTKYTYSRQWTWRCLVK